MWALPGLLLTAAKKAKHVLTVLDKKTVIVDVVSVNSIMWAEGRERGED
jgi:CBS-domain-containing membrane protein